MLASVVVSERCDTRPTHSFILQFSVKMSARRRKSTQITGSAKSNAAGTATHDSPEAIVASRPSSSYSSSSSSSSSSTLPQRGCSLAPTQASDDDEASALGEKEAVTSIPKSNKRNELNQHRQRIDLRQLSRESSLLTASDAANMLDPLAAFVVSMNNRTNNGVDTGTSRLVGSVTAVEHRPATRTAPRDNK